MRSKQYQGELSPKSASEGIKLAYENALDLLSDAELLLTHDRFERCVSLSILAILLLLRSIYLSFGIWYKNFGIDLIWLPAHTNSFKFSKFKNNF